MPLTEFQRSVMGLLAAQRSPDRFMAGGSVINVAPESPRYSDDFDIFHDAEERECAEAARELVGAFPAGEVGALYLDESGQPVDPNRTPSAWRHYASWGGAWPQLAGAPAQLPESLRRLSEDQAKQRYRRS